MRENRPQLLTFRSGFVQDRSTTHAIAQYDQLAEAGAEYSSLLKWYGMERRWDRYDIEWSAIRVWVETEQELRLHALGVNGETLEADATGITEGSVDASGEGPLARGPMRDLRWIGRHLYAVGMGRQVYRREEANRWARRDAGVVVPVGTMEVVGFNSVDGLSEEEILACGFGGEIWRNREGEWVQLDSPTNLVLHRLRIVEPDLMFASGQEGLLLRGTGEQWEVIDHGVTDEDLWGLEWYRGSLYVASQTGVFRLTDADELERIDMGLGPDRTCSDLHANDGVMWSFGPKHLSWTDGTSWIDATP